VKNLPELESYLFRPLNAATEMLSALTIAFAELDVAPPRDGAQYLVLRASLIEKAIAFASDMEVELLLFNALHDYF
jgi:hypothetical protein